MKKSPQTAAARRTSKTASAAQTLDAPLLPTAEQLAHFYDNVDAALFSLTVEPRQTLRFLFANQRFLSAGGLERGQVFGRLLGEIIPEPSCARVLQQCRKSIRSRQTVRWEETYAHSSAVKYGEISVTPVIDSKGRVTHLSGSINDITQRRQSELALHESEERYRRIVQTAEEGIWTIDAQSRTDYVNPKMAQMMGYKAEEMLGRPISDFLDEEGQALLAAHIKNRKNGISDQFEFKYIRKNGTALWAFVSTNPITNSQGDYVGAMALLTDITARRAAEAAMRESNEQFRVIFEQAAVGVALIDSNTGRFINVNQRVCDIAHQPRKQMIGARFIDLIQQEDVQSNLDNMQKLKAGKILTYMTENRLLQRDGSITWINFTVSPMWKKGESPTRHIAIIKDITERKQTEHSLARTTYLLERTGEMAKIGGWELDVETQTLFWSLETCRLFEIEASKAPTLDDAIRFYTPATQAIIREAVQAAIDHGKSYELELPAVLPKDDTFGHVPKARPFGRTARPSG